MVDCPKCKSHMNYVKTDAEIEIAEENHVTISASQHYHCITCYADLTLRYRKEVKLE